MKLISNVKAIILLLVLVSLAGYFVVVNSWQQGLAGGTDQVGKQVQPAQALPDFDQRKVVKTRKKTPKKANKQIPVEANFNADEVLAQSEQQLDVIIGEYNQVLDDPQARKVLEQRMQETAKTYKKAILAKVNKGEI